MSESTDAPATLAHALAQKLTEDQAFLSAIGLALAGLAVKADCEHLSDGIDVLIEDLGHRLDQRIDVVEGWAAARRSALIAV
jgi:hypothetical protein